MYDAYFGFHRRPFVAVPHVDRYFPGSSIETARTTLLRCLERGEGAAIVVGPSGTGKTLLCQLLAEQLRDRFRIALLLMSGRLSTRRNLFQAILYELGRPYRGMDEGELRLALVDFLTAGEDCPHGMVLLVDEAHTLPLRLLDEIRMLTNIARDGQPCVRLVLSGAGVLEERFSSPRLDSFNQRLVGRCYLESFNRTETKDYLYALIESAGGSPAEIFSQDACQSVYQVTDGVPRLINQVCDHALLLAYANDQRELKASHIEEAWADLQQLPTPRTAESDDESLGSSVIEFGSLDEEPKDEAEPAVEQCGVEEDAVRALRISPETKHAGTPRPFGGANSAPTDGTPPGKQLERIEELLVAAEKEDFQPAGSIGPEVELIFEDPFTEEFEQEEIVSERYPSQQKSSQPPADEAEREIGEHVGIPSVGQGFAPPNGQAASESPSPADTEPDRTVASGHEIRPKIVPLRPREPLVAAAAEGKGEDLILVEDDYDDGHDAPCPVVPVRRHEYGRLFAKLRRG